MLCYKKTNISVICDLNYVLQLFMKNKLQFLPFIAHQCTALPAVKGMLASAKVDVTVTEGLFKKKKKKTAVKPRGQRGV